MRFRYRPRTSREPTIPPSLPPPPTSDVPRTISPRTTWTSTSGWVAERGWIVEVKGVPLRAGWLVEWADMYAVSAPPTGRHLGIDVDQAEGRKFCAARGRPRCTLPWLCVCAPPHTPHSPPPPLPVCHLTLPLQLTHPLDILVRTRV